MTDLMLFKYVMRSSLCREAVMRTGPMHGGGS